MTLYPGQPAEKKLRFTADIFTAAAQRRPDDSDFGVSPNIEARPYVVLQGSLGKSGRVWRPGSSRIAAGNTSTSAAPTSGPFTA